LVGAKTESFSPIYAPNVDKSGGFQLDGGGE
jgi:hypothetical protein